MQEQNYSNHTVFPKGLVIPAVAGIVGNFMILGGLFFPNSTMGHCLIGTGALINGACLTAAMLVSRVYATKLQDRIIRTEMRVRLREVLPEAQQRLIPGLTRRQLVGLRFASDAELPDLVQKVVDENIEKADPIKKLVKDWQADHERV